MLDGIGWGLLHVLGARIAAERTSIMVGHGPYLHNPTRAMTTAMPLIYLDNAASTPTDPRVAARMMELLASVSGNASSPHWAGRLAKEHIEVARSEVAALIGADPQEIIFTSGATEANNLAIKGISSSVQQVLTGATEHPSVLESASSLVGQGIRWSVLPCDYNGLVDVVRLEREATKMAAVVSIMASNNETGVISPMEDVVSAVRKAGAIVHCDATQLLPWGPFDVKAMDVDMASISGHKLHGPTGIGALYVRRELQSEIHPLLSGGGHERGLRSGSLNTVAIVGLGEAARVLREERWSFSERVSTLRDEIEAVLVKQTGGRVNGAGAQRVPGITNISIPGCDADAVLAGATHVAASNGSACRAGAPGPSHVLEAMNVRELAESSIRLSLSRMTTDADISAAVAALVASIERVREMTLDAAEAFA